MNGHKSLKVFQLSYRLAMEIFELSKRFPVEEKYSLTDQIRRSSRSVSANISEAYRKRQYPNAFAAKLSDSDAECAETQTWLDFSRDCGYISAEICERLNKDYEEVGRMIGGMISNPQKFTPKH